jgi:hypothetical protein
MGLKLEGFDEVEDVMFWLCALLWKAVDGLMGERQYETGTGGYTYTYQTIVCSLP